MFVYEDKWYNRETGWRVEPFFSQSFPEPLVNLIILGAHV